MLGLTGLILFFLHSKESGVTLDTMDPLEILANQETRDHWGCPVLGGLMENEEYPVCRAFRDQQ